MIFIINNDEISECCSFLYIFNFQDAKLRGRAYVAMGRIGKRLPRLFSADIGLVQSLFNAVAQVNWSWSCPITFQHCD